MQNMPEIGMGNEARVYCQTREGIDYALKVFNAPVTPRPELYELNHPNIVRVHKADKKSMLMEYFDGKTFEDFIEENKMNARNNPEEIKEYARGVMSIILQVSEGLRYANEKRIRHNDIKPGNIMVGEGLVAKLIDFSTEDKRTKSYCAPERVNGESNDKSDVYSLGRVGIEALTDLPIFDDQADLFMPREYPVFVEAGISEELSTVLEQMLELDPDYRIGLGELINTIKGMQIFSDKKTN